MLHKAVGFMQDPEISCRRMYIAYRTHEGGQQNKTDFVTYFFVRERVSSVPATGPSLISIMYFLCISKNWSETDRNLT